MFVQVYTLYKRQPEGCGFTGAGLGECHQVVFAVQQAGYNLFLHGHGSFETHFFDGAPQRLIYP